MTAIAEASSDRIICYCCGKQYPKLKPYFPVSYAPSHKGVGHLPICRECVDKIYTDYLNKCCDTRKALRQFCRRFDLYFNQSAYSKVVKKSSPRSLVMEYLTILSQAQYIGHSYDDTLRREGSLWTFEGVEDDITSGEDFIARENEPTEDVGQDVVEDVAQEPEPEVSEEVKMFWGPGYTNEMYDELETRRIYWMSKLPASEDLEVGAEAIIRQICATEIDINKERKAGHSVDKQINTLNTLLASACLKPTPKKEVDTSAFSDRPLGKWIQIWEDGRPVPEVDPDLEDVDGLRKYIHIWVFGHLAKMLGIKNSYSKAYEKEIAKYKVERPDLENEDDSDIPDEIFGGDEP